jgi:uncharacterized membrane-anchored protein
LKESLSARSALPKRPETRQKRHRSDVFNPWTRARRAREGVFQHAERFHALRWEAEATLETILSQGDVSAEVRLVAVNADEEARRLKFPGSPTLRVDGEDLFPCR